MVTCRKAAVAAARQGGRLLAEAPAVHGRSAEELVRRAATPALVYDYGRLCALAGVASQVRERSGARVLYALKACAFHDVLQTLAPALDGFAASSLFEARLARDLFPDSPIHLTTPGLRDDEVDELTEICSALAFNSASQLHRWGARIHRYASVGIRVNTLVSNISDHRYDPARPESKLGIPLAELPEVLASSPVPIHGLHFHTNADSDDLRELEANVEALADSARGVGRFKWVNFGGGYLFGNVSTLEPLERSVELAKRVLADEVFVEPGAGLVRDAGRLVASVIDVFERDGNRVAILDTSVNHLPEVLEFGYQPEVEGSTPDGCYEHLLAGGSCLAGDVFGRYRFDTPLVVGAAVTFKEAGAYAQAKSHRFNGINLPSVWMATPGGTLKERQSLDYESYLQQWRPNV